MGIERSGEGGRGESGDRHGGIGVGGGELQTVTGGDWGGTGPTRQGEWGGRGRVGIDRRRSGVGGGEW